MGGTAARYVTEQGPGPKQLQAHLVERVQTGTHLKVTFWSCQLIPYLRFNTCGPQVPVKETQFEWSPAAPAGMVHPPPREIVDRRRAGGLSIHVASRVEMTRGPNLSRSDTPLLSAPP